MAICFFVTDLHGHQERYEKLHQAVLRERPAAVFFGGDLMPSGLLQAACPAPGETDFIFDYLIPAWEELKQKLGAHYPEVFLILGNDDGRLPEESVLAGASRGLWHYAHERRHDLAGYPVYGYCCIPPSPFRLKDWERYDVSRYVDLNCIAPGDGILTVPVPDYELEYGTIAKSLEQLAGKDDLSQAIFLFHSPPYQTDLDRAALDGMMIDHAPVDVHIGSIAIKRFIEKHQPLITLHGHVHESARLTSAWHQQLDQTHAFSAAHDGPELALVKFDPANPTSATRELL